MSEIRTWDRTALAGALRRWADRVEGDETIVDFSMLMERPARELDPLLDECPFDGFRHHEPGPVTNVAITIRHSLPERRLRPARSG